MHSRFGFSRPALLQSASQSQPARWADEMGWLAAGRDGEGGPRSRLEEVAGPKITRMSGDGDRDGVCSRSERRKSRGKKGRGRRRERNGHASDEGTINYTVTCCLCVCECVCVCVRCPSTRRVRPIRCEPGKAKRARGIKRASERAMLVVPGLKSVLGFGLLSNKLTTSRIYAAKMPRRKEARGPDSDAKKWAISSC